MAGTQTHLEFIPERTTDFIFAAFGEEFGLQGAIVLLVIFEPRLCAEGVDWKVLHEYQRQRVCTLLDPTKDPLGKGFHIIQGMIAIG